MPKVIKEVTRMEYDKHILNSHDIMGTSWKLIN